MQYFNKLENPSKLISHPTEEIILIKRRVTLYFRECFRVSVHLRINLKNTKYNVSLITRKRYDVKLKHTIHNVGLLVERQIYKPLWHIQTICSRRPWEISIMKIHLLNRVEYEIMCSFYVSHNVSPAVGATNFGCMLERVHV